MVGCLQFSSPAGRMAARNRWVGWDEGTRARNLQRVVNNSRYRAANWVALGTTSGRRRMDRLCRRVGETPKTVLVYPLIRDAKRRLRER